MRKEEFSVHDRSLKLACPQPPKSSPIGRRWVDLGAYAWGPQGCHYSCSARCRLLHASQQFNASQLFPFSLFMIFPSAICIYFCYSTSDVFCQVLNNLMVAYSVYPMKELASGGMHAIWFSHLRSIQLLFSSTGTDMFSHAHDYLRKGSTEFSTIFYYVRILLMLFLCKQQLGWRSKVHRTMLAGYIHVHITSNDNNLLPFTIETFIKSDDLIPCRNELTSWSCRTSVCPIITYIM